MCPLPIILIILITLITPIQKNLSSYKKTAASRGAQPTSNQKTIFYKKSIFRYFFIFYDVERFCKILTPPPRHRSHRKWSSALHLKRFRSPVSIRIVALFRLSRYSSALAPCWRPAMPAIAWEHVPREQRKVVTLGVRSLLLSVVPLSLPRTVRMARGLYFVFLIC